MKIKCKTRSNLFNIILIFNWNRVTINNRSVIIDNIVVGIYHCYGFIYVYNPYIHINQNV